MEIVIHECDGCKGLLPNDRPPLITIEATHIAVQQDIVSDRPVYNARNNLKLDFCSLDCLVKFMTRLMRAKNG